MYNSIVLYIYIYVGITCSYYYHSHTNICEHNICYMHNYVNTFVLTITNNTKCTDICEISTYT